MKQTSAELKRKAREKLCGHWGILIGAAVLNVLIIYAAIIPCYVIGLLFAIGGNLVVLGICTVFCVLVVLASTIISAGITGMNLKLAKGQEVTLGAMFSEFTHRPYRYILGSLLLGLIGTICMIPGYVLLLFGAYRVQFFTIVLGFMLLVGGIVLYIFLILAYALVFYLFLDYPQMGVIAAFKESARLMKGNKGRMFYLELSFIGWGVLAMLSCGIGMLWVMPYMTQTFTQFYLEVTETHKEEQNMEQNMSYDM